MWKTEYRCIFCERELNTGDRYYCGGRCPYCGNKAKDTVTIVKCTEHAYRWEKVGWFGRKKVYKDT